MVTKPNTKLDTAGDINEAIAQNKYITINPSMNTINEVPRCILSNTLFFATRLFGLIPATTNWSPRFGCMTHAISHLFSNIASYLLLKISKVSNRTVLSVSHGDA
jgi:hypothetical protein